MIAALAAVINFVYSDAASQVKTSEFKRWLRARGARFEEGTRHTKVYLGSKQSTLPRHPSQELGEGLRKAIVKQLGLKDD